MSPRGQAAGFDPANVGSNPTTPAITTKEAYEELRETRHSKRVSNEKME